MCVKIFEMLLIIFVWNLEDHYVQRNWKKKIHVSRTLTGRKYFNYL